MSKDRVDLSKQTFPRLVEAHEAGADIWWMDGSVTAEGEALPEKLRGSNFVRQNVRGGPDAAVAYAVTECLKHDYTHIGIVENDVLLQPGWYEKTMLLATAALDDCLVAGAVSARCYEDRVLFRRDQYSVMHNLGFGMVIWTRQAAELMLKYMRTHWTLENRRTFHRLAGVDIGDYWAFRVHEGWLCADWGVDRVLAQHGLCSLALDPSPVEMIGQIPSLQEQGLVIATGRKLGLGGDTPENFRRFVENQRFLREGLVTSLASTAVYQNRAGWMYFAHQLGGFENFSRNDAWRLHWQQGFGPFGYRAKVDSEKATVRLDVAGACSVMVSGHDRGGPIVVRDLQTGYEVNPVLPGAHQGQAAIMGVVVPGGIASRTIEVEVSPGVIFFGVMTEEPQPQNTDFSFNHGMLPCP